MNWLKTLALKALNGTSEGISLVSNWLAGARWLISASFLELAQRAYSGNVVFFATLRFLAQSVAEAPMVASAKDASGDLAPLPPEHPLAMLLSQPNELQTGFEMTELLITQLGLVGRSFWWRERSLRGETIALWPLRPDRVGFIYSASQNAGERVLSGYSYRVPGQGESRQLDRADVIAFALPDPAGESGGIIEGLGPGQVLVREIEADNEATTFVGALLKNYASPNIILKTKTPIRNKDQARLIKQGFQREFGGQHRGEPALLDADTEIDKLGFNLRELEFPDVRAVSESRISAALGVPAVLVGLKVGLATATYSNVDGLREVFAETTCATYWKRIGDVLTNQLAAEFGVGLVVAADTSQVRALSAQRQRHAEPIKDAFARGSVTLNEYRQRVLSLPPLPDTLGDVFFVPSNVKVVAATESLLTPPPPARVMLPSGVPTPALPPGQEPAAPGTNGHAPIEPIPVGAGKSTEIEAEVRALLEGSPFRDGFKGYP